MKKEWDNLTKKGVWELDKVKPKAEIKARMRKFPDQKAHFGRIFGICTEKGSELEPDNVERKMKGRVCVSRQRSQR